MGSFFPFPAHVLMFFFTIFALVCRLDRVLAQVPLPTPAWLPPDASTGAQPSQQNQIPNSHWSSLLGSLLYFFEAQRSGSLPSTKRIPWRNDSAVDDGQWAAVDLSGGYYDAGNYIKATYPLSFTLMSVCWGATDYGKGYDLANQTPYLDDMLRWGLAWLMKAHPSSSTLYVYVGDGQIDNDYWGGDLDIPKPRPVFQVNDTHPGTDAVAAASAAFSACSSLYASQAFPSPYLTPAALANETYASTLLTHAQQLYSFALNATGRRRLYSAEVPPSVGASYNSTSYAADLVLAAAFLARAERSKNRWQEAVQLWDDNHLTDALISGDTVFNWAEKSPGVPVLLAQMALPGEENEVGGDQGIWQERAERWADGILQGKGTASKTPGGLLFLEGDSNEASLNPALNIAMLLMRYAQIASTDDKKTAYMKYAQSQLDYALGENPMSVPYVVGVNPNSPSNPHSALASGGNNVDLIDTVPAQETYIIYGAVVGGPDRQDRFWDIRSDFPETEVALDYNAPLLTLTAMHLSNTSTSNALDPPYVSLQPGAYAKRKPEGLPCDSAFPDQCRAPRFSGKAAIAVGISLGVIGAALLSVIMYWVWLLYKRRGWPKVGAR